MKIEKNKIVFLSVIGLVLLFLIFYSISAFGGKEKESKIDSTTKISPPNLDSKEVYKSKLEAISNKEATRVNNAPSIYNEAMLALEKEQSNDSLEHDKYYKDEDSLQIKVLQEEIEKLKKAENVSVNKAYNSQPRQREVASPKKPEKTQHEKDLEALREWERQMNEQNRLANERAKEKENRKIVVEIVKQTDEKIFATISGDQELASGERLKMRLTQQAVINDINYPRNTFIYGFVKYAKNRIYIQVNNVESNPVHIGVYDAQDGSLGLYTDINIVQDGLNEAHDNTIDEVNTGKLGKVINSGKKIFKKKNKPQKILLLNNTQLILKKNL